MIQRKQTIFLILALAATIACLMMPLGRWELSGMGIEPVLYNLGSVDGEGVINFKYCALFILAALSSILSLVTIFRYKNRKQQMTLCKVNLLSLLLWYVAFVFLAALAGNFRQQLAAYLPFIAAVFVWLAHKGIAADEKLVRSADRIR